MHPPVVSARRAWIVAAGASAIVLALFLLLPRAKTVVTPDGSERSAVAGQATDAAAGDAQQESPDTPAATPPSLPDWQILLLPEAGVSADPSSVRIGLAYVSAEDVATDLLSRGADAAGAADAAEFAQVRRWQSLPATLQADGAVRVGPLTLQGADRYVLQAAGTDRLRQYHANFARDAAPPTLLPIAGAGLRVRLDAALGGEISLLLRRAGELSDGARWHSLLQRHPDVLGAFGEQPWPLRPGTNELAPLPPQAVEAVLLVDGIEAQRQRLTLAAGSWAELAVDPLAHAVARQLAVELTLRFVVRGSDTPVAALQVTWQHERGERIAVSDERGRVRFAGVDRQREQQFTLQFPEDAGELPAWPQSQPLAIHVDESHPDRRADRQIEHVVELDRLAWLVAASNSLPLDPERTAGQPYPVYVLQHRIDGAWQDAAAEYFRKVDAGLAVSLSQPGEYRVAAVMTPWTVYFSDAADTRVAARDGRHRVRLEALPGRSVELRVSADGRPLPRAQLLMPGPLRGLPPFERVADSAGRVRLDGVTVDRLLIEVPGYAQAEVALQGPLIDVVLQGAADIAPD